MQFFMSLNKKTMTDFYCDQIIPGKINVEKVFETENVLAFHHTRPYWERHIVIIPKKHIDGLSTYQNNPTLNADFLEAIQKVTKILEDKYGGCRVCSNVGNYQTTKHLHWYVHQGRRLRAENGDPITK